VKTSVLTNLWKCLTFSQRNAIFPSTGCPKYLEPMGILIMFLIFIYRLKLKVKRIKMALTLDERVEILYFGDS
jgi:hypothetical protein